MFYIIVNHLKIVARRVWNDPKRLFHDEYRISLRHKIRMYRFVPNWSLPDIGDED